MSTAYGSRPASTDLNIIRSEPSRFTWGTIQRFHDINHDPVTQIPQYTIVEYIDDDHNHETLFSVYVDGKPIKHSCKTLDRALIKAIASRNIPEPNEAWWMSQSVEKILNLGTD